MIDELAFAFGITGPVLVLLVLGRALRAVDLVDDPFVARANALVFNVALPALLFFSIAGSAIGDAFDPTLTLVGLGGTLLLIALLLAVGRRLPPDQRGVFVQGSYRGNLAILGVALAVATYGSEVLPLVALYIAVVTTVYNVVAVWLLESRGALRQILRNPIILGIAAGALASLSGLPIPLVLERTGDYLAGMALPIALLCIGGEPRLPESARARAARSRSRRSSSSSSRRSCSSASGSWPDSTACPSASCSSSPPPRPRRRATSWRGR